MWAVSHAERPHRRSDRRPRFLSFGNAGAALTRCRDHRRANTTCETTALRIAQHPRAERRVSELEDVNPEVLRYLNRLSDLALSARPNLNHAFVRSETAEAIDFVLYCERDHTGRRRVRELISVTGYAHADQSFQTEEIYRATASVA